MEMNPGSPLRTACGGACACAHVRACSGRTCARRRVRSRARARTRPPIHSAARACVWRYARTPARKQCLVLLRAILPFPRWGPRSDRDVFNAAQMRAETEATGRADVSHRCGVLSGACARVLHIALRANIWWDSALRPSPTWPMMCHNDRPLAPLTRAVGARGPAREASRRAPALAPPLAANGILEAPLKPAARPLPMYRPRGAPLRPATAPESRLWSQPDDAAVKRRAYPYDAPLSAPKLFFYYLHAEACPTGALAATARGKQKTRPRPMIPPGTLRVPASPACILHSSRSVVSTSAMVSWRGIPPPLSPGNDLPGWRMLPELRHPEAIAPTIDQSGSTWEDTTKAYRYRGPASSRQTKAEERQKEAGGRKLRERICLGSAGKRRQPIGGSSFRPDAAHSPLVSSRCRSKVADSPRPICLYAWPNLQFFRVAPKSGQVGPDRGNKLVAWSRSAEVGPTSDDLNPDLTYFGTR